MSLDSHVTCSISVADAAVSKDGFDTIMIASYHTRFLELIKEYTSTADMTTDGFKSGEAAFLAASAAFAQNPRVTKVKIGRRDNEPTQIVEITPTVRNSTTYTITITDPTTGVATDCSYTSNATALITEILTGLDTAVTTAFPTELTTDITSGTHIEITGTSYPNNYFAIAVSDDYDAAGNSPNLARSDTTIDPGVSDDLGDIETVDGDWYVFTVADGQDGQQIGDESTGAAKWAEANSKIYVADFADEEAASAGTGVAHNLKEGTLYRSASFHTRQPGQYPAIGLMAQALANDPGSQSYAYKTIAGASPQGYTSDARSKLLADNCNIYYTLAGLNITFPGKLAQGRFIDIQRGIDWLKNEIQTNIISQLANLAKIPFTDEGISIVTSEIWGALKEGVDNNLIAKDPVPVVTAPLASAVSTTNKANRLLPDVEFSATLAGAIHTVTITGKVSV